MDLPNSIQEKVSLAPRTTLGVGGIAQYYADVHSLDELKQVTAWAQKNDISITILGGGSNVLIKDDGVKGLVIHPEFLGITYEESEDSVMCTAGAGVVFDNFVAEVVEKKLWGIENLSGIPGSVGATPIQNVGAYGVEVSDCIHSVTTFNIQSSTVEILEHNDCMFGYRDSFFKTPKGKKYLILDVCFKLSKKSKPKLEYKDLILSFEDKKDITISEIRDAVIAIRANKFPDWTKEGTAGSFFKNPIVRLEEFQELQELYPDIPGYPADERNIKVSLGYILDKICGLKGYEEDGVRLYEKQALVLVCEKGIESKKIIQFSDSVVKKVFEKTKIKIEREVTLL